MSRKTVGAPARLQNLDDSSLFQDEEATGSVTGMSDEDRARQAGRYRAELDLRGRRGGNGSHRHGDDDAEETHDAHEAVLSVERAHV